MWSGGHDPLFLCLLPLYGYLRQGAQLLGLGMVTTSDVQLWVNLGLNILGDVNW